MVEIADLLLDSLQVLSSRVPLMGTLEARNPRGILLPDPVPCDFQRFVGCWIDWRVQVRVFFLIEKLHFLLSLRLIVHCIGVKFLKSKT